MSELGYFDRAADLGDVVFEIVGGPSAKDEMGKARDKYLKLVVQIYRILAEAHDVISNVVLDISMATDKKDVKRLMERLEQRKLKSLLKTEDLCEKLAKSGTGIRELLENLDIEENLKTDLTKLSSHLEEAEGGTADLYVTMLRRLTNLQDTTASLESLQMKAEDISKELIVQKARFDFQVKKARAMLKHQKLKE